LARATPVELQRILVDEEPPRPSTRGRKPHPVSSRALVADLDWIVLRALEKDRERR
jgi:hypothetical protein